MGSLHQVKTISRQVYQILKEEITSGVYKPNDWLQEKELADRLQVSRSPIREALRQLAADGLAVEIPNKGMFVRSFSLKEIMEIYEIRRMMESSALRSLKGKLTKEMKRTLESFREDFIRLHQEGNLDEYTSIDSAFHRYIIECTGNTILMELYRKVRTMNMTFRILSLKDKERFDESQKEHVQIIDYMIADEMEKASDVNDAHLTLAKESAIQQISENNANSEM